MTQTTPTLEQQYPSIYKLLGVDEQSTMQEIISQMIDAKMSEADLPIMEAAIAANPNMLENGMPFPGDDPKWDAIVAQSKGLQLVQKYYNYWG